MAMHGVWDSTTTDQSCLTPMSEELCCVVKDETTASCHVSLWFANCVLPQTHWLCFLGFITNLCKLCKLYCVVCCDNGRWLFV